MSYINLDRAISLILTVFVVGILVFAGPARSFELKLDSNKNNVNSGEKVKFNAEIDINESEILPIEEIEIELNGPEKISCRFNLAGDVLSGCKGMDIKKKQEPKTVFGYGYGYFGYGYGLTKGKLSYDIEINTSEYKTGSYSSELKVKIGGKIFKQEGNNLTIEENKKETKKLDEDPLGCRTEYRCTEWSICENGQQIRTCSKKLNYCYAGPTPELVKQCVDISGEIENLAADNGEGIKLEETPNQQNLTSRITGAVIGAAKSPAGLALIIIFLIVIASSAIFLGLRRKNNIS